MTGREPAAFTFIDLSGEASEDDRRPATKPLLTRRSMSPGVQQPVDDAVRRMQPPPPPQDNLFRHPGSTRVNSSSSPFHRPADSSGSLRQQSSWTSQRLVAARHHIENSAQVSKRPTKERDQALKDDHAHLSGSHLTLASSSHQAAAEFDRLKQARKDAANRHKQLMLLQEASQEPAIIQQSQAKVLAMQASHDQASKSQWVSRNAHNANTRSSPFKKATQQAGTAQPSHHCSTTGPELHLGPTHPHPPANSQRLFTSSVPVQVPLISTWVKPTTSVPLENHGSAANKVDKMKAPAAIPAGSLKFCTHDHQQQSPDAQAAHPLTRASGSGCQHDPGKAQMTIFYASMVNVYDDVPFDLAQTVCMMLKGHCNKRPPPLNRMCCPPQSHDSPAQAAAPVLVPEATPSPPPKSTHMSAPPSLKLAPSTSEAGPSHSKQEPVLVSSVWQPTPTPAGELPQARKASLARFLERRKDRIRSKEKAVRGKMEAGDEGGASPSHHDDEPRASFALWRQPAAVPSSSKQTFPTRPPPTLPRQNISSQEFFSGSTSKRRFEEESESEECGNKKARIHDKTPTVPTTTEHVIREYRAVLQEFHSS